MRIYISPEKTIIREDGEETVIETTDEGELDLTKPEEIDKPEVIH